MKQPYFTSFNLKRTSQALLLDSGALDHRIRFPFQKQHSALLVLDMQRYFYGSTSHAYIPSMPPIVPGIKLLIEYYRQNRWPVIFTRHVNATEDAGMMKKWWRQLMDETAPETRILDELQPNTEDVINKSQYDAFFNTDLKDRLHSQEITQIVVTGVMTHLCCETTARSAFMHGFEVVFPVDGTATYTRDYHVGSLRNLAHGFARICRIHDICGNIDE